MSWIAVPPPIRNPQSAIRNLIAGFRWTIKRKLLALGGATVLPMALLLAVWLRWEVREHQAAILDELRVVSQQAAAQVQEFIHPVRDLVTTLASLPPVRNLEPGPTQDLLRRFQSGFHHLANVFVYAADGRFIASAVTRPGTMPPTPTDRRWFRQELETGRPVVSDFLIGRVVGEPVIVVAAPVRDPGEAPRAVVAASVTLRHLQDHFRDLPLAPGRTLLLVDAEGKVLAGRGEGGRPTGSAQESAPIGRQIPDALRDPASPTLDGVPVLSAVAPIPGTAWRVLAALPRATVEARVQKEMRAIALPGLGILGTAILVGFVIARRVWGPLQEVAGAVREFAAGRFTPVRVHSLDEVGDIAAAFNSMGVAVQQRNQESQALFEVSKALTATLGLEEVLDRILEKAAALLRVERAWVLLVDAATQDLEYSRSLGFGSDAFEAQRLQAGEGVAGRAVMERAPAQSADILVDPAIRLSPETRERVTQQSIRAALAVPFISGGRVLGALAVGDPMVRRFREDEVQLLSGLASVAAVALENARLFEAERESRARAEALALETGRHLEEMTNLGDIAREITSQLDLERVLESVTRAVVRLLGCDVSSVGVCPEPNGAATVMASAGTRAAAFLGTVIEPGRGLGGKVLVTREPASTEDYLADTGLTHGYATRLAKEEIHGSVCVPLFWQRDVIGLLWAMSHLPYRFSPGEIQTVQRIADVAAIALQNARLLEVERQSRAQAEALAEVAQALLAAEGEDQVLDRIIERARVLFDTNECAILLPGTGEAEGRLVVRRGKGPWAEILAPGPTAYTLAPGEGVGGLAYARGTPVWTPDNLNDPAILLPPWLREVLQEFSMRAALSVPLMGPAGPIGVMTVNRPTGHRFTPAEVGLLQRFAAQAAIGLRQEALRAETRRHLEEVSNLGNVAREITSHLDLERVLEAVAEAVRRLLGCDLSTLAICAEANGPATVRAGAGHKVGVWYGKVVEPGRGLGGKVLLARAPAWTEDYLADASITRDYVDLMVAEGMRANLAVPLLWQGDVIGVLWAISRNPYRYTPAEIRTLERLADVAAIALQNARLFSEAGQVRDTAQRERDRALALSEVGRVIVSSLDLERVLDVIVQKAQDLLGARSAVVRSLDAASETLRIERAVGLSPAYLARRHCEPMAALGVTGRAVAERRTLWTRDNLEEATGGRPPAILEVLKSEGFRAVLAVPIRSRQGVFGVLAVHKAVPHDFAPDEVTLAESLAHFAGIALDNARLVADLNARQARLAALLEANHQLAAIQPLDVVLAKIAEACGRLLDSDSVGFRLVEGDELVVTGVWGDAREAMPTPRIKLGESLSGFVASTGEPLVVQNLAEDSRLLPRHRDAVLGLGHRGWLGVPVKVGESVVGVLSIRTRREQGFSQDDLAAAAAFAAQAAIALENARLVEAEHQSRAQAEALAEVGQALLAAESEDEVLDLIIARVSELFGACTCAILLEGTGEFAGRLVVRRGSAPWASGPAPHPAWLAQGEGVSGLAYARGVPVWTPDNLHDPAIALPPSLREVLGGSPVRAALSVPLLGPRGPIGVVTVNRPTGHVFSAEEIGLLRRFATLTALALHQEGLRSETRRRLEEATNLGQIAREITSQLDLNRVLVGVTEAVRRLLGSELSTLAICDEPNGPATVVALAGSRAHQEAYRGNVLRPGVGLGGTVLATRASAWVEDFVAEIELPDDQAARAAASRIRGNLCAPLLWQGDVIGLLWACHTQPHRFTSAEVHTLERLADVAAIAIQNARLFSASQAQAAALAEKNAQLDSFVYVVSHDLKAPLITIEGMASILRENHANALDPEANHLLERIQANVRQLERLTGDLLALSRIGREARAPEPVDLTEVVGRLLVEWDGPIRARGVQVGYGDLPTLQAIRTQMEQVIGNLLGNALKYLGDAPSPRVEIGAVEKDGVVECYVKDNGIGIDPAYHGRVFEIFERLKEVEAEGTGVGLAIVKKIVEGAGGRVWVESVKGEGATFRFTWPKAMQEGGDGSH